MGMAAGAAIAGRLLKLAASGPEGQWRRYLHGAARPAGFLRPALVGARGAPGRSVAHFTFQPDPETLEYGERGTPLVLSLARGEPNLPLHPQGAASLLTWPAQLPWLSALLCAFRSPCFCSSAVLGNGCPTPTTLQLGERAPSYGFCNGPSGW